MSLRGIMLRRRKTRKEGGKGGMDTKPKSG